mgnify:CR=1 FL=1
MTRTLQHPCPWNRERSVGVGIDFGYVRGYPGGYHYGIDMYAPVGEDIEAAADGAIVYADDTEGDYGLRVDIDHGDGLYTVYAHLDSILVDVGGLVVAGDLIGACGNTGNTVKRDDDPDYGSHLHFEVRLGGNAKRHAVDPMEYITPKPKYFRKAKLRWK